MNVYRSFDEVPFDKNTVVTVGTFDGVHRGHQQILNSLLEKSSEFTARPFAMTFEPHPQIVLQKVGKPPIQLLTSIEERLQIFEMFNIPNVLVIPFSQEFSEISSEDFIKNFLIEKVGMSHILIGFDHNFGKNREGNEELLQKLGGEFGFTVEKIPAFNESGTAISSTRIRQAIKRGDIEFANEMLGYPYIVIGTVVRGDGRGRNLGFATANIQTLNAQKLLPANGVYFVGAMIDGVNTFGMANIGTRPTFTDDIFPTLEAHFFDFDKSIYDKQIIVSFLKFIREERKFTGYDMFFSQLTEDKITCLELAEIVKNLQ